MSEKQRASRAAKCDLLMNLTPDSKKRTAEQLGWELPAEEEVEAKRSAQADMIHLLTPNSKKHVSRQLGLAIQPMGENPEKDEDVFSHIDVGL